MALAGALCLMLHAVAGLSNRSLGALVAELLGSPFSASQMSDDLRRLGLHGLVEQVEHRHCYTLTDDGRRFAVFYSKLGDRDSGFYLARLAWTKIVRHQMVKGDASPDDPALAAYWAKRRRKNKPLLDRPVLRMLKAQDGRCPLCEDFLLYADSQPQSPSEWEQWLRTTRMAIRKQRIGLDHDGPDNAKLRLVHAYCQRRHTAAPGRGQALLHAY